MNELWLFVEHNNGKTWTRATIPENVSTVKELIGYLLRGGSLRSDWIFISRRARFKPRVIGMTVIATLL